MASTFEWGSLWKCDCENKTGTEGYKLLFMGVCVYWNIRAADWAYRNLCEYRLFIRLTSSFYYVCLPEFCSFFVFFFFYFFLLVFVAIIMIMVTVTCDIFRVEYRHCRTLPVGSVWLPREQNQVQRFNLPPVHITNCSTLSWRRYDWSITWKWWPWLVLPYKLYCVWFVQLLD